MAFLHVGGLSSAHCADPAPVLPALFLPLVGLEAWLGKVLLPSRVHLLMANFY